MSGMSGRSALSIRGLQANKLPADAQAEYVSC